MFAGIVALVAGRMGSVAVLGIGATGVGAGGLSPLTRSIPPELEGIGTKLTGTAVGFIFAVGEIGGFFGSVLVSVLHDATRSYVPGFGMLAARSVGVVLSGSALVALYGR
jgi:nitrate/nitrite transporter NarK